jgi:hypothetical protein
MHACRINARTHTYTHILGTWGQQGQTQSGHPNAHECNFFRVLLYKCPSELTLPLRERFQHYPRQFFDYYQTDASASVSRVPSFGRKITPPKSSQVSKKVLFLNPWKTFGVLGVLVVCCFVV